MERLSRETVFFSSQDRKTPSCEEEEVGGEGQEQRLKPSSSLSRTEDNFKISKSRAAGEEQRRGSKMEKEEKGENEDYIR
eukprot:767696-Hanusia_phi.AAC.4